MNDYNSNKIFKMFDSINPDKSRYYIFCFISPSTQRVCYQINDRFSAVKNEYVMCIGTPFKCFCGYYASQIIDGYRKLKQI